jgi:hypothetical protein
VCGRYVDLLKSLASIDGQQAQLDGEIDEQSATKSPRGK